MNPEKMPSLVHENPWLRFHRQTKAAKIDLMSRPHDGDHVRVDLDDWMTKF